MNVMIYRTAFCVNFLSYRSTWMSELPFLVHVTNYRSALWYGASVQR